MSLVRAGLCVDPCLQIAGLVDDTAAEAKAAGSGAEMAPVAQGGYGARTVAAASSMVSS
jgi:hypothetical protein